MAAGDLTTVADVKSWAQLTGSVNDTLLGVLVTAASAWITTAADRDFTAGAKSFSEIRDGSGGMELLLANTPVLSITTLTVDTLPIPAQPADGQPGYFLVGRVLTLFGYRFSRGRKNVRVAGTYGFTAIPPEIAQACKELVISQYQRGRRGTDVESETIDQQTYKFRADEIPMSIKRMVDSYKSVVPV